MQKGKLPKLKKRAKQKYIKIFLILMLIIGLFIGKTYNSFIEKEWFAVPENLENINIFFSKPEECKEIIAREIFRAEKSIYIQSKIIESTRIIEEIRRAQKRRVKIFLLLNHQNEAIKGSTNNNNIHTYFTTKNNSINNQVIIIDNRKVILTSLNLDDDNNTKKTYNMIMLINENVAKVYLKYWLLKKENDNKIVY